MRPSLRATASAALLVVFLADCGSESNQDASSPSNQANARDPVTCTEIGCSNGIAIDATRLPKDVAEFELCTGSRCIESGGRIGPSAHLEIQCRKRPRTFRVSITAFSSEGEVVASGSRRVRLTPSRPNGPDCPPVCWSAGLRFSADTGALIPQT